MRLSCFVAVGIFLALGAPRAAHAQDYPFARHGETTTALDRYVAKPDGHFTWSLVKTEKEVGVTSYTLDMTSQQWRSEKEVDRPIWRHWVTISVPDDVQYSSAMMYIDGGTNEDGAAPASASWMMKDLARHTHSIAAAVMMVPNQWLVFSDAFGFGRFEDSIIAYTWDKFFRTGDEEWPIRLPMTKAVVRAMDAVQAFCSSDAGGKHAVKDFVVAGASKRGWTTWTTAIVDTRVRAIAPVVIDSLNGVKQLHNHFETLGFWSIAFGDYKSLQLDKWLDTPENAALLQFEDPYSYRDRLQMPKLMINASNDQFFMPDSCRFYWDDLQGPKWIRYVPNSSHIMDEREAYRSVESFYLANIADRPMPNYKFTVADDGAITVTLLPAADGKIIQPTSVKFWQAHNPKSRDFRGFRVPYVDTPLAAESPNVYVARPEKPAEGFTAYFIELTFGGASPESPFIFTSGIRITPDVLTTNYVPPAVPPKGFLSKN